jgi:hypothetical protein
VPSRVLDFACLAQGSGIPNERPACCLRFKELSAVALGFGVPRLARFGKRISLDDRLALSAKRTDLKETSADGAFIDVFFRETWGYVQTSPRGSETGFSLYPKFAIPGAGANGGSGEADLAIGYFSKTAPGQTPQVFCKLKGIHSALDTDHKRQGNARSWDADVSTI